MDIYDVIFEKPGGSAVLASVVASSEEEARELAFKQATAIHGKGLVFYSCNNSTASLREMGINVCL